MITMVVLIVLPAVLILGLRLLFHAVDPHTYAPAGSPGVFSGLSNLIAEFGVHDDLPGHQLRRQPEPHVGPLVRP